MRVIIEFSAGNSRVTVANKSESVVQGEGGHERFRTAYSERVIVRVLTARVSEQNAGQFNDLLRKQLDELRAMQGLVYAKLARRLSAGGAEEVILFEEWQTPDDLWAWTGGHLNVPRLLPGTEQLIDRLTITHYEALDMDVDDSVPLPDRTLPDDVSARG
jgi:hypothetical protein